MRGTAEEECSRDREIGSEEKKNYLKQLKQVKYSCVCVCACVCVCVFVTCTPCSCQVQEIFGPVLVVYVYPAE